MSLEDRRRQLQALGITSKAAPAAWLAGPVAKTDGIAKLEREHVEKKRKLKEDADQRIANSRQHKRELVAQNKRHGELLREEMMERRRQEDRVELTQRRDMRDFLQAIGGALSPRDERQLQDEVEEQNSNPNDPSVRLMRTWLEREWTAAGIDVRVCVEPALRNGAAARVGGWVEIPPIQSLITAEIVAHELGHLLHPAIEHERVINGEFGRKISVSSENASWRWVLAGTPVWTAPMHIFMGRCLESYRSSAIALEATAMDVICSQLSFRQTQLRILREK